MAKSSATKPSPSVTRAIRVLNFLAEHPQQSFNLTELQRKLKLSRTTCHAVLLALLEAGYVHRGADKAYVLGPVLAEVGRAAAASLSPLQIAQPEMRRLADQYDAICSAVFVEGDEMVVRDRASSAAHLGFLAPRGVRLPLEAPAAAIQFAWSPRAQLEAWLKRLSPRLTEAQRQEVEDELSFVRTNGFAIGYVEAREDSDPAFPWKLNAAGRPIFRVATTLEAAAEYQVAVLQGFVFDHRGRIAFNLSLTGLTRPLPASDIMRVGADVRDTCERITGWIGGRRPELARLR
jgi:DNA-binding IclR family transcriptional regulator